MSSPFVMAGLGPAIPAAEAPTVGITGTSPVMTWAWAETQGRVAGELSCDGCPA